MKILVTGGAGYIASKLIPKLAKSHAVSSVDIKNSITDKHCNTCTVADISDIVYINNSFDVIIHTVATFSKDAVVAYKVNVESTKNIIDYAIRTNSKFILLSTCGILNPKDISTYTITKKQAEDAVINRYIENSIIIRLASVYGPAPVMNYAGIVNGFIHDALTKCAIDIKGPDEYRPVVYIDDAVNSIIDTMDSNKKEMNIVSENVTKQQIIDCIVNKCEHTRVTSTGSDNPGYKIEPCLAHPTVLSKGIAKTMLYEISGKIEKEIDNATIL